MRITINLSGFGSGGYIKILRRLQALQIVEYALKSCVLVPFLYKLVYKPSSVFDDHLSRHIVANMLERYY